MGTHVLTHRCAQPAIVIVVVGYPLDSWICGDGDGDGDGKGKRRAGVVTVLYLSGAVCIDRHIPIVYIYISTYLK